MSLLREQQAECRALRMASKRTGGAPIVSLFKRQAVERLLFFQLKGCRRKKRATVLPASYNYPVTHASADELWLVRRDLLAGWGSVPYTAFELFDGLVVI
jgi:hypothetical protein